MAKKRKGRRRNRVRNQHEHSRSTRKQNKAHRQKVTNKNMFGDRSTVTPVLLTTEVYEKQRALIERCDVEICWFGTVKEIEYGDKNGYLVDNLIVPEQTVSTASVDADGKDLMPMLMQYADIADRLNYFGHSHVNFPSRPSETDLDQIKGWGKYGIPYIISHIENKDGEMHTRIDQFQPRHVQASAEIMILPADKQMDWADEEMFEKLEITKLVKHGNMYQDVVIKEKGERKRIVVK